MYLRKEIKRKYSSKNQYDKFSIQSNVLNPVHEIYNVNLPDYVTLTYDCIVWTDLIEQNNEIIERISYASEDYWGDRAQVKFRTYIDNFNLQTEVPVDGNRIIRSNFELRVKAYLLPEFAKDWEKTTRKDFSVRRIVFDTEIEGVSLDNNFPTSGSFNGYTGQGFYGNTLPSNNLPSYPSAKFSVEVTGEIQSFDSTTSTVLIPNKTLVSAEGFKVFIDGILISTSRYTILGQDTNGVSVLLNIDSIPNYDNNTSVVFRGNFR
jgi:hypothetical protein